MRSFPNYILHVPKKSSLVKKTSLQFLWPSNFFQSSLSDCHLHKFSKINFTWSGKTTNLVSALRRSVPSNLALKSKSYISFIGLSRTTHRIMRPFDVYVLNRTLNIMPRAQKSGFKSIKQEWLTDFTLQQRSSNLNIQTVPTKVSLPSVGR